MRLKPNAHLEARFESVQGNFFTSSICVEEIRYGACIASPGNKLWERFASDVLPLVTIIPFDEALAIAAGELRAEWKRNGTPAGYGDGLIAATAKQRNLTLVTRNVRHFDHVRGLVVENWFEAES